MAADAKRICKDCNETYELTPDELRKYTVKRLGQSPMTITVRCPDCRAKHTAQVKHLARATVSILNAETGEGCYLPIKKDDLPSILASWGQSTALWDTVTPEQYGEMANVVAFNVDNQTVGLVCFENAGGEHGLAIKAVEYAPWVDKYTNAHFAIPLYAITESIRRGYNGKVSVVPKPEEREFYISLGAIPLQGTDEYIIPPQAAQLLILFDEGVKPETLNTLMARASVGEVDLGWLARKLAQKRTPSEMVDEITKIKISWATLRLYLEDPDSLSLWQRKILIRKLQGLFLQLKTVEDVQSLDSSAHTEIESNQGTRRVDILVQFTTKTKINHLLRFDPQSHIINTVRIDLPASENCIIECKAWRMGSYTYPRNINRLISEIKHASKYASVVIVTVSSDFNMLQDSLKKEIVRQISECGAYLKVVPGFPAGAAQGHAENFVSRLGWS